MDLENPNIYITGDFNFDPSVVEWEKIDEVVVPKTMVGETHNKSSFQALLNLTDSLFLSQIIHYPTRLKNVLDLCFTNDPHSVINTYPISVPRAISDHNIVHIDLNYASEMHSSHDTPDPLPEIATYDFPHGNLEAFGKLLEPVDWDNYINLNDMSPRRIVEIIAERSITIAKQTKVPKKDPTKLKPMLPPIHRRKLFQARCRLQNDLFLNPPKKGNY